MFIALRFLLLLLWTPLLYIDSYVTYEVFFMILHLNGPFFIKLTQLYASVNENKRLEERVFDNIHEHSYEKTKEVYRQSFNINIDERYILDSHIPIASGSIGQVYKAYDNITEQYVAIKVRHPGIFQFSMKQIACFKGFLMWISKMISIVDIDAFILSYSHQIDMRREASNMSRFNDSYKDTPFVTFPIPIEYSEDVIVMTYLEGLHKNDVMENPYLYNKVALFLFTIVRSMSVEHGFLHCDLHQGNWAYDPKKESIIIYDTGCAMELDNELVRKVCTHVYTQNIKEGLQLFMKRMLVNEIPDDMIQEFIENNNNYILDLENDCRAHNVLNTFKRCAKILKTPIKNEMLFLFLSSIVIENILRENTLMGVTRDGSVDVMKSELSLLNQYRIFPKYQNFLKDCLVESKNTKKYDTDMVAAFYNLKECES